MARYLERESTTIPVPRVRSHRPNVQYNQPQWDAFFSVLKKHESIAVKKFNISYTLAGEGDAIGVSNKNPFATKPDDANVWIKEGLRLLIRFPVLDLFEALSTDPNDSVCAMWKGTQYAHI